MITYKIHQIKDIANTDYAFRGYHPEKFSFSDYECRYQGVYKDTGKETLRKICEELFYIFNMQRPEDFTGHSLSISDVIELVTFGDSQFYYCDMFGFTRLHKKDLKVS
jgi:hypothetical protein